MKTIKRTLALLGCLALAPALAVTPEAYQAQYEVLRNGRALGTADVRVSPASGGYWEMHSQTRGTRGLAAMAGIEVTERSRFRWTADTIEAVDYDYEQRAATRSRQRSVRVDAGAGRVVTTDRDNRQELAYQAGVLDRHILPLALARDLSAGRTGTLTYLVAERGEIDEHVYRVVGRERVDTPKGAIEAVKVQRERANRDRVTTLWLDPANGFLPVRVVQNEGGDSIETRLVSSAR